MTRRMICTLTVLCSAIGPVRAQDDPAKKPGGNADALDLLRKSQTALKKVEQVKYRGAFQGLGWVAEFVAQVEGATVMGRQSKYELDTFRSEVKLTPKGKTEPVEITVGSNGDVFFLIDPKTKTAYEDMDPAVLGSVGRDAQRLIMPVFGKADPYGKELDPESVELKGTETVGEVECQIVGIKGKEPPDLEWFIATTDYLPRRVRRLYPNQRDPQGPPGTTELTISDLVVNPKLDGDPFKLTVPEGFTKSDDFAP